MVLKITKALSTIKIIFTFTVLLLSFLKKITCKLFRSKESTICEKHGHLFTSERYKNLKVCPECNVAK